MENSTALNVTDRILELLEAGVVELPTVYMALRKEGWDEVSHGQFEFVNKVKNLGFTVTQAANTDTISL